MHCNILPSITALLGVGTLVSAHMQMQTPPPLKSQFNKLATSVDSDMTSPLKADGSNFPCKGYQSLMGTAQGGSVATYSPGQKSQYTIVGGANHNGGSCQASLSYDQGKTFTVIGSVVGDCPGQTSSSFDFTIPSDAPTGDALFAWTWFNKVGNREMYMNCAVITIGGSGSGNSTAKRDAAVEDNELFERDGATAFTSRPALFVANVGSVGGGCGTTEGTDVLFPNPGPDLVQAVDAKPGPPTGNCAAAAGSGTGSGSASSAVSGSGATTAAAATSAASTPATSAAVSSAAPSSDSPGGVFVTASDAPASSAATSAAASSAQPTTMQTSVKPSGTGTGTGTGTGSGSGSGSGTGSGSQTNTAATPAGTGTGTGTGTGGSAGTACTDEGAWNCIDGSSFSRCASGQWSAIIPMAAGTSCQPGVSDSLVMARKIKRNGPRRSISAWTGSPAAAVGDEE